MFKKLLSFVFALFVSITFLAGCNLIKVNNEVYYTQVIAEIVYKDGTPSKKFYMKDLLSAYNSYGSQYVQNGQSVKEAVENTIDIMLDRYLLTQELRNTKPLSQEEKYDVLREVYANMNSTLSEIEQEVRKSWGLELVDEDTENNKTRTPLRAEEQPYKNTVEAKYNDELKKHELVKVVTKPETEIIGTDPGEFVYHKSDEKVSNEAWKRYIKDLRKAAELEGKKNLTEKQLINREIKRIYAILEDNKYLSKFSNDYYNELPTLVNTYNVVERYKVLFKNDYMKYANNLRAYHQQMRTDSTKVYYHPQGEHYLNVTHILVKLSDEANKEFATIEKLYKSGQLTEEVYKDKIEELKNSTYVTYELRDANNEVVIDETTGQAVKVEKKLTEVYNEIIVPTVETYNKDTHFVERAKAFNKLLYMFNDDEGIMNRDFAYVVNLTDVEDMDNIMIKEFTDASRMLHFGKDKDGNQLDASRYGKGAISEPVFAQFREGEYGFHIIMNLGVVENPIVNHPDNLSVLNRIGENGQEDGWWYLYNVYTQPSSTKSLFELINDELNISEIQNRETNIVNTIKRKDGNIKEIKLYTYRYKNLWK